MKKQIYIICGPTASGKSEFALSLGGKIGGVIINADSMQVYDALKILTSSPSETQKQRTKHYLYNFMDPEGKYSVASYIQNAQNSVQQAVEDGYIPIIVGGTGLYINGIVNGISQMPEIHDDVREQLAKKLRQGGVAGLYQLLEDLDPQTADKLSPNDKQRISRSLEVYLSTGKSIIEFQQTSKYSPFEDYEIMTFYLKPERSLLYDMCNSRFLKIIKDGALEEVRYFMDIYQNSNLSITNALGFKELSQYLLGACSIEDAIFYAQRKTRNYAKRQYTWFNNQINWKHEELSYSSIDEYESLLQQIC